jgi:hypothetical protein
MDLIELAEALRDRGMSLAADAQDRALPGFSDMAFNHICDLASRHEFVHIDLFLNSFHIKPEHPNAFGAPWQRAKRERIIEHSGRVRPCTVDPAKNAHLYPVYRSLIYRPPQ